MRRRLALALLAALAVTVLPTTPGKTAVEFPIRAAFYYPWFPNAWTQGGLFPYTHYTPTRGFYDSGDPALVRSHIDAMMGAKIEAGIASWWGQGHHTDGKIAGLLSGASDTPFKWTLYHEQEGNQDLSVSEIQRDLFYIRFHYASHPSYLRVNGLPVLFVYNANDSTCDVVDRWTQANVRASSRPSSIPPKAFHLVMKVFSGYRDCVNQPQDWHQYGTGGGDGWDLQAPYSAMIAPGFFHAREATPRMERDLDLWRQNIRAMVASGARWQLIVSWNEWGEGTQVEESVELGDAYLEALATDGVVP